MKFNTLCVATLSAIVTGSVLAYSPYDVHTPVGLLVNESLDGFGYSMRKPSAGEIWELAAHSMRVLQVVDGGVLVERGDIPSPDAKCFFVKTSRIYADGDMLATGYYKAEGTISYKNVLGAQRTVYAFSELSASQQQKIQEFTQDKAATAAAQRQAEAEQRQRTEQTMAFKKSKERIAAEEAAEKARLERERAERENAYELARLNKEKDNRIAAIEAEIEADAIRQKAANAIEMARLAREREEQDKENRKRIAAAKADKQQADAKLAVEVQKERGRYAADVFSSLDFNFKHYCVIQRSIRKNVRLELVDPEWEKLAGFQARQDWLGLLGAIDDEEYDEFPSEKEIDTILDSLKKKSFCVSIKGVRPPSCVNVHARRMSDNSSVREDNNGWGKMAAFFSEDEVRSEKVKVAPFDGKVFVIDSDYKVYLRLNQEVGLKPRQDFGTALNEKAEEIEEWLKRN